MDLESINKYVAGSLSLSKSCDNPYNGQKHYFTKGLSDDHNTFYPELFIASNVKELLVGENTTIIKGSNKYVPYQLFYQYKGVEYMIINKYIIDESCRNSITQLFLHMIKDDDVQMNFDYSAYYALYNENIEFRWKFYRKNENDTDDIIQKTCLFYVEYGYWHKMFFKPINGLLYIASYPELIKSIKVDIHQGLYHYFTVGVLEKHVVKFNPYMYIASNIDKLKDLVDKETIKIDEATKHYILNGFYQGLKTDDFDCFLYLANNPKRIRELLKVDEEIVWDFSRLTPTVVCEDYLKHYSYAKRRKFDHAEFVQNYVGVKDINFDRKLNIDNAAYYFVRGYTCSKCLRKTLSSWGKFKTFLYYRSFDSLKQIPLNLTRFILQSKFF